MRSAKIKHVWSLKQRIFRASHVTHVIPFPNFYLRPKANSQPCPHVACLSPVLPVALWHNPGPSNSNGLQFLVAFLQIFGSTGNSGETITTTTMTKKSPGHHLGGAVSSAEFQASSVRGRLLGIPYVFHMGFNLEHPKIWCYPKIYIHIYISPPLMVWFDDLTLNPS